MKAILRLVTSLVLLNFSGALSGTFAAHAAGPAASPEQDAEAAIMPFLDVLANPPSGSARSFQIKGRVEAIGGVTFSTNLADLPQFEFAIEAPNRMRIVFPMGVTTLVACRNDQKVWAAPGTPIQTLLALLPNPPESKKSGPLAPIQIPFAGKQLAFLPALLQISSKGEAPLDGVNCRVLDVRILPQIAQMLPPEAAGWAVRLWLNPQNRPVRLGIQRPGGSAVIRIEQIQFAPSLPPELWQQPSDAVDLPVSRLQSLLSAFGQSLPTTGSAPKPN